VDNIFSLAQEQKQALLENERRASSELVRAYGLAYSRIQARIAALTGQIDDARQKGEIISSPFLYERDRLKNLQIEIEREMRRFALAATERVTAEQGTAIKTAATDAQGLLSASAAPGGASSSLSFGALNTEAMATLAGFAGDGSPLRLLFESIAPQMANALSDELVSGVIEGAPARVIASRIREQSGMGLARALLISRQEILMAYRTATLENYKAAGVASGWRWMAAQDARTCLICFLMDGKEFPLSVKFASHVSCRCAMIPVSSMTPPARRTGVDRFGELEPGVQKDLLGIQKFALYKSGDLDLNDFVGVRHSPQWGTVRYLRSLKELLATRAA
jgi:SPP1 gp7 family putative phage head morphogenesis protein